MSQRESLVTETGAQHMPAIRLFDVTTPGDIADELGTARAELAEAKARVEFFEEMLKAQRVTEAKGSLFKVKVTYGIVTRRVDWQALARDWVEVTDDLTAAYTRESVSDRLTISAHSK